VPHQELSKALDKAHEDFIQLRKELQDLRAENLLSIKAANEAKLEVANAKTEINQNINRLYEKKIVPLQISVTKIMTWIVAASIGTTAASNAGAKFIFKKDNEAIEQILQPDNKGE
jgi:hypothetical protein